MNTAWIGLIGTLLGVLIGGLVTYLVNFAQFKRDKKLKEQQIIRKKLEEICQTIGDIYISHRPLYLEAIMHIKDGKDMKFDINPLFNRLKMLVYFYAPSLKSCYDLLCESRFILGDALVELSYCSYENKKAMFNVVGEAFGLFERLCEKISESSADIARSHFD